MIHIQNVSHTFTIGKKGSEKKIPVLKNISFEVAKGEMISIVGKSGSGKSTLLNAVAGFLKPEEGSIIIQGKETTTLTESEYAIFRSENIGFIFQNFQLMPGLTAFENIELPLKIQGIDKHRRFEIVNKIIRKVGLETVFDHYPNELSGGQQQRVCIARALITNPPIILADEPTGNLDSETEQEILQLIALLNESMDITFIIITHDEEVANIAHRKFLMHDGVLKEVVQHAV